MHELLLIIKDRKHYQLWTEVNVFELVLQNCPEDVVVEDQFTNLER